MAIERPIPPTPPTPLIEGSHSKIDAHKLFQMPFQREETIVETPAQDEIAEIPAQKVHESRSKTPEEMARDAVANGSGALTKRTVIEPAKEIEVAPKSQTVIKIAPDSILTEAEADRGKAVLREFDREDIIASTEKPQVSAMETDLHDSHGGLYWLVMLMVIGVLSFIVVKKFLLKDEPALKKSELFEDSSTRLKNVADRVSKFDNAQSARLPKQDDRGKHFEVRV